MVSQTRKARSSVECSKRRLVSTKQGTYPQIRCFRTLACVVHCNPVWPSGEWALSEERSVKNRKYESVLQFGQWVRNPFDHALNPGEERLRTARGTALADNLLVLLRTCISAHISLHFPYSRHEVLGCEKWNAAYFRFDD